jgi:hypothetical protein
MRMTTKLKIQKLLLSSLKLDHVISSSSSYIDIVFYTHISSNRYYFIKLSLLEVCFIVSVDSVIDQCKD